MGDTPENSEQTADATISDSDIEWFKKNEPAYEDQFTETDDQIGQVLTDGGEPSSEGFSDSGQTTEGEGDSSESESTSDSGETASGEEETSPIYQKALDALHRGLPESMRKNIDSMSREEVLEAGLTMASSQAEQDAVGSKLGRLDKSKDSQGEEQDSGDVDAGSPEPRSEEFDPTATLEPYDLELNPEDLPSALADVIKAAVTHTKEAIRAEMQGGDGNALSKLQGEFDAYKINDAGRQLEGRFPQLRDAKHMADVQKTMRQIEPTMEYTPGATAQAKTLERMELACGIAFGKKASQPGKKNPGKRNQPPGPSRKPASNKSDTRTQHDKDWAFFKAHEESGGNVEQAKRAYRGY